MVVVVGLLLRTEERKLRRSQFGTFSLRIIERPPGPSWSITAFFLSSLSVLSTANINGAQCQLSTMNDHSHVYLGTTAFVAGILLTVGFKDLVYPALEQRLQQYQSHDDESRRRRESQMMPDSLIARPGPPAIVDGVEGCIGNTPLFRIKSLSEETGCEILGKAEVFPFIHIHIMHTRHDSDWI